MFGRSVERSLLAGHGVLSIRASCASREVTVCNPHPRPYSWLNGFELRQQWSDVRLTQEKLATAFSVEEKLAAATVSSWESLSTPKLPPRHRLLAYARFFATQRSVEAAPPTLLALEELTADEHAVYETLESELLTLRGAAAGDSAEEEIAFSRSWHFADTGRVTFVCAELPSEET